jgi:hypothetical protein
MPGPAGGMPIGPLMADVLQASATAAGLAQVPAANCATALGLSGVSVSVMATGDSVELIWYAGTDELGVAVEDLQFTIGEGPTLDAARHGRGVLESDLAQLPPVRWPLFLPEALLTGVAALFSFPLRIGAIRLGVFTGYRTRPGPLSAQQLRDALAFMDRAILLLLCARPGAEVTHGRIADLDTLHRAEVHQATGMLSERLGIPLDQALVRLRAHAFSDGRPLLDTARDIIDRRSRW